MWRVERLDLRRPLHPLHLLSNSHDSCQLPAMTGVFECTPTADRRIPPTGAGAATDQSSTQVLRIKRKARKRNGNPCTTAPPGGRFGAGLVKGAERTPDIGGGRQPSTLGNPHPISRVESKCHLAVVRPRPPAGAPPHAVGAAARRTMTSKPAYCD